MEDIIKRPESLYRDKTFVKRTSFYKSEDRRILSAFQYKEELHELMNYIYDKFIKKGRQ